MQVECIKIINPNTGIEENVQSGWGMTVGKKYNVLEVYFLLGKQEVSVRLDMPERVTPLSANIKNFKLICGNIPSAWKIMIDHGNIYLSPQKWIDDSLWRDGFWEDYLSDTSPEAERVFKEERDKIIKESGVVE